MPRRPRGMQSFRDGRVCTSTRSMQYRSIGDRDQHLGLHVFPGTKKEQKRDKNVEHSRSFAASFFSASPFLSFHQTDTEYLHPLVTGPPSTIQFALARFVRARHVDPVSRRCGQTAHVNTGRWIVVFFSMLQNAISLLFPLFWLYFLLTVLTYPTSARQFAVGPSALSPPCASALILCGGPVDLSLPWNPLTSSLSPGGKATAFVWTKAAHRDV